MINSMRGLPGAGIVAATLALTACGDPPSARVDGCALSIGEVTVDLREVIGFNYTTDKSNWSILVRGKWVKQEIDPKDREYIELAWRDCRADADR